MLKQTDHNLSSTAATEPLTRWLISAANDRRTLTYGEIKRRLETECNFETIFSSRIGNVLGAMMDKILEREPNAPMLNVLAVSQQTRLPGEGALPYLLDHFPNEDWLADEHAYNNRASWKRIVNEAAQEVYAYRYWERLYRDVYKKAFRKPDPFPVEGEEKDGIHRGRGGEGKNHKDLRCWVKKNPERIDRRFHGVRAETEEDLLSGDRVDVVFYGESETVAIEVKSRDSKWADLQRGIYQCVKYRAVLSAQNDYLPVESWLVTETALDGDLKALSKKLGVKHKIVSRS